MLIELGAVERPEMGCASPQHPRQAQLRLNRERGEVEIELARVSKSASAGRLGVFEGRARDQHQLFDVAEKVRCVGHVSRTLCQFEASVEKLATAIENIGPRSHK